jgi:hypothetical protein
MFKKFKIVIKPFRQQFLTPSEVSREFHIRKSKLANEEKDRCVTRSENPFDDHRILGSFSDEFGGILRCLHSVSQQFF